MPRLDPLDRDAMTPEQRRVADAISSGPRGGMRGPFEAWLRSPVLAERAQLLGAYCRFESSLAATHRELAILITGRFWSAQFEFWAHSRLAGEAGLDPSVVEAIRVGRAPVGLDESHQAVYDLVTEYLSSRRVSDRNYARAVAAFGESGLVDLIGVVGYYGLVSMTLNTFEVPVPEGEERPFPE